MKIGIDISQVAYSGTGVARFTGNLVSHLLKIDNHNEYVLFYSSLRNKFRDSMLERVKGEKLLSKANVELKIFPFPPIALDLLWNRLHILPIEHFIGEIDLFISSDWTQPPAKQAKMITVLHDLIYLKFPRETHPVSKFKLRSMVYRPNIVEVQKRRMSWVAKECDRIICVSKSTKNDAIELLNIDEDRLVVIYQGV